MAGTAESVLKQPHGDGGETHDSGVAMDNSAVAKNDINDDDSAVAENDEIKQLRKEVCKIERDCGGAGGAQHHGDGAPARCSVPCPCPCPLCKQSQHSQPMRTLGDVARQCEDIGGAVGQRLAGTDNRVMHAEAKECRRCGKNIASWETQIGAQMMVEEARHKLAMDEFREAMFRKREAQRIEAELAAQTTELNHAKRELKRVKAVMAAFAAATNAPVFA